MSRDRIHGDQVNLNNLRRVLGDDPGYASLVANFHIPPVASYNMAADTVDRHADGENANAVALICEPEKGPVQT